MNALEAIQGWSWNPREHRFMVGLGRLKRYVTREGNPWVPAQYVEPDGSKLASWVRTRRAVYRKGKLTPERIAALEAIEGWIR